MEAEVLLDGMLAHDRLLDLVENFILFDASKPGGDAQNRRPESPGPRREQRRGIRLPAGGIEEGISARKRLTYRIVDIPLDEATDADLLPLCPSPIRCERDQGRGQLPSLNSRPSTLNCLRFIESRPSRSWQTRRLLAHPGQR